MRVTIPRVKEEKKGKAKGDRIVRVNTIKMKVVFTTSALTDATRIQQSISYDGKDFSNCLKEFRETSYLPWCSLYSCEEPDNKQ